MASEGDGVAGYNARMRGERIGGSASDSWVSGWWEANRSPNAPPLGQTISPKHDYTTIPHISVVPNPLFECRVTAARLAGEWAQRIDSRVDLEKCAVRIERYLTTGDFDLPKEGT